jgi:hypothetical protein
MRFALSVAAVAVMLSTAVFSPAARAADCMADPKGAIKAAEAEFKKAKGGMDKAAAKGVMKALDKAKMAARTKQNDVACESIAKAQTLMGGNN